MTLSNNSTPSQSVGNVDPEGSYKKGNSKPVFSYSELELARIHTILKELEPLGYKLEIVISTDLVNYEVVVTHLNKSYTISEVIARYYNVYSLHLFDENGIPRGDSQ